jgi:hypothetical protein
MRNQSAVLTGEQRSTSNSKNPQEQKGTGRHLLCEGIPEADASMAPAEERKHVGVKSLDCFNFFRLILPHL